MPQELSYKHPDGWVITTQNFSEGQTDINSPTKSEPSGWVNVPNIDPYQGLVKVEQLDVNSLSAITANMGSITSGTITMDSEGYIKGGQTAYNTGTGFFLGYDGSAYKFSIGGATKNLKWDGTDLIVNGSTVNAVNFELNGTGVTANANELNLLDGKTALAGVLGKATNVSVNTTGEQTLFTASIPDGALGTNGMILLKTAILLSQSGAGTDTVTLRFKLGSTTVLTITDTQVSSGGRYHTIDFWISNNASASSQKYGVTEFIGSTLTNPSYGTSAVNTATGMSINITADNGASDVTSNLIHAFALLQ